MTAFFLHRQKSVAQELRDGNFECVGVFDDAQALVGDVEQDDRSAESRTIVQDIV